MFNNRQQCIPTGNALLEQDSDSVPCNTFVKIILPTGLSQEYLTHYHHTICTSVVISNSSQEELLLHLPDHNPVHEKENSILIRILEGRGFTNSKMPCVNFVKAVPLQAWSGPEGSRKLRFPDFMTTAQNGGKVVSLTHRPPLSPGSTPGTHFC